MQGSPPRRSRRPPPKDDGPLFPLLPVLIGVIVLGFVIGSGLSLFGKHPSTGASSVAAAPTVAATIPPATNVAALDSPSARATVQPAPRPSMHALKASPPPRVLAVVTPSPEPSPTQAPTDAATSSSTEAPAAVTSSITETSTAMPATPVATQAPRAIVRSSPDASATAPPATPQPTAAPPTDQPPAPGPVVRGATSPFARLAASVVRVYLGAIGRGDRDTAIAELATHPSGPLPEEGVVDSDTQIRTIDVHGAGDVVTVDVDLKTAAGPYTAQYTVDRSTTGAALIAAHSIVKL